MKEILDEYYAKEYREETLQTISEPTKMILDIGPIG